MNRRRSWIGLAAGLLVGCAMSPPSPVEDLLRGGWVSGGSEAPEPVAVPPGTPDAPRPSPVAAPAPPPAAIPGVPSGTVPGSDAPKPDSKAAPRQDVGRQPLRLNVPLGDAVALRELPQSTRIPAGGAALPTSPGSGSPALSARAAAPLSFDDAARLELQPTGVRGSMATLPAAPPLEVGASDVRPEGAAVVIRPSLERTSPSSQPTGRSPGLGLDVPSIPAGRVDARPGLSVSRADAPASPSADPLHLGMRSEAAMPPSAASEGAHVPAPPNAAPVAGLDAGGSPRLGQLPGDASADRATTAVARIGAPADAPAITVTPGGTAPRASAVVVHVASAAVSAATTSAVVTVEPGRAAVASPGASPAPAKLPAPSDAPGTVAPHGAGGAIATGAFDDAARSSGDPRRQAERQALEDERRAHGSALRRWLESHFPFLF